STILRQEPTWENWFFLADLTEEQLEHFDSPHSTTLLGEIGSRNIQRLYITEVTLQNNEGGQEKISLVINDWVNVQENTYRYHAIHESAGILIKIIFSEFLGAEVFWKE
ncbi:MAG: hypothetical protein GY816_01685, partial [Cytophagales bacterium]|nr:hypothetical protein [Cytophagales bacterium]